MIKIRAHHLLCIQGFQGYGYSKEFASNMAQVIKDLKAPNGQVKIIAECDVICSNCPYNKKGICEKDADSAIKIKNMDMKVLKKLGFKKNEEIKAKNIFAIIKNKLKNADIEDICGDCQWKTKCLLFNSL